MTWHGSETLPSFNRSDPFEPDPVDTGVGKGTDRPLGDSPSIAQSRVSNIQKLRSNMKHTLSALALLSIATTLLFAEESAVSAISELPVTIVTGELWESELQKTTASVTVLDRAALEDNGVQHFEDVINAIPNLTWTGGTSRPRYIQIRGIGENSQFEGETPDSSVRFLVDDLDFTGVGTIGNLFDVQQVEVLRGPQAGAFGANAAGGMIRIVTNDPTPYWTGQAENTIGSDSLFAGGFAVGGPLLESDPEKLTFRFALHQLTQDGFRENVFRNKDDTNEHDELTTRLKLRWITNQDWEFDGQLFYVDINNGFDVFSLTNNRTKTFTDQPGRDEQQSLGISLRSLWLGNDLIEIVSTTAYSSSDSLYSFDGDFGAGTGANPSFESGYTGFFETKRDRDVFSQEIRVDSREDAPALGLIDRWTLGIYLESFDEITHTTGAFPVPSFNTDYEAETAGLFGQITHEASETLRFSLGLRGEYYQLDGKIDNEGNTTFDDGFGTTFPIIQRPGMDYNDTLFGGKITVEYDLSTEHLAFASFARGYKAGGINLSPSLDLNSFDPSYPSGTLPADYNTETLHNYELGLRSNWFEGAVETKVTAFYLQRDNAQLRGSVGSATSYTYFTVNVDKAEHFGLEAEIDWKINRNWKVNLSGGLLETDREQFSVTGAPTRIISDRSDLSNSPEYNYAVRLDYNSLDDFFANIEITASDVYFEENTHEEKRNAYNVVNASFGYRYENWTFTIWSKNLFDRGYEDRVFFFDNFDPDPATSGEQRYEAPAAPRTFGVTANYKW